MVQGQPRPAHSPIGEDRTPRRGNAALLPRTPDPHGRRGDDRGLFRSKISGTARRGLLWPLTSGAGAEHRHSRDRAAGKLLTVKRGVFLERVVARLSFSPRFTAAEFDDAVRLALRGLIQEKSAA